ncbi:DUF2934 domain-containing protein [Azospirillum sp. SYSU D00513]|uniref:DUF2934 domain-containing protein n=1 Tax=Azospirillum sp. SYSU D00513 TaxID=2812561 RepID=UPI001A97A323|nr:DUF2934 domain-containing protein [Azospirillum sp. SYSU D00513]
MASRKTATPVQTVDAAVTDAGAEVILRTNFSMVEQDVRALLRAASLLMEADTADKVNLALDHNMKLWIAIKTVIQNGATSLSQEVTQNLTRLAQYVSTATLAAAQDGIDPLKIVSLSRINVNIAEGLLRGQQNTLVRERAYQIWEEEGRPNGRENEHWMRAEAELSGTLMVL